MAPPAPPSTDRFPAVNPLQTERSFVTDWKKWLDSHSDAAQLPVTKVEHMKNFQESPVHHEFMIVTVKLPAGQPAQTQRIVAERQISTPPDQVIYGPWDDASSTAKHRSVFVQIDLPYKYVGLTENQGALTFLAFSSSRVLSRRSLRLPPFLSSSQRSIPHTPGTEAIVSGLRDPSGCLWRARHPSQSSHLTTNTRASLVESASVTLTM